ncbi:hypothetical protein [Prevotella sp. 10(H)]|uniref:hypothetical protein n=1 Tax=Prevotella sp. 10(H) TaxID=1158294 RepID=UPI0004A76F32|nr:hypothetical protein [Prevotella sp. 10(H)]
MHSYSDISFRNQEKAYKIIEKTGVIDAWKSIGAEINLVGSLKMGLLVTRKDIDFHIYTPSIVISDSFRAMAKLAEDNDFVRVEYINAIDTEEKCIEWHAWYRDDENELWQLDMIHILAGSKYDGYFERMAQRINEVITSEQRNIILKLKYETPESEKIIGVEYYKAVIKDGVKTFQEFREWRKDNPSNGIIEWIP